MPASTVPAERTLGAAPMDTKAEQETLLEWTVRKLEDWERHHQEKKDLLWPADGPEYQSGVTEVGAGAIWVRTGVHAVTHHQHRARHNVTIWAGEMFPACRECRAQVSFEFLYPLKKAEEVEHIG